MVTVGASHLQSYSDLIDDLWEMCGYYITKQITMTHNINVFFFVLSIVGVDVVLLI